MHPAKCHELQRMLPNLVCQDLLLMVAGMFFLGSSEKHFANEFVACNKEACHIAPHHAYTLGGEPAENIVVRPEPSQQKKK